METAQHKTTADIDVDALIKELTSDEPSEEQKERDKKMYQEYCRRYAIYGTHI